MQSSANYGFREWVRGLQDFIEQLPKRVEGEVEAGVKVAPPLSTAAIDSLANELGRPIPRALRAFLESGSAGVEFNYRWAATGKRADQVKDLFNDDAVWGGGELCQAKGFSQWLADCKSWAEDTWIADEPEFLEMWTRAFPILPMANADFIALDGRKDSDDPAVLYLSHDDESKTIVPDLGTFLNEWARLKYVGPESWMLEGFLDEEGFLSSQTEKAKAWMQVVG